MTGASPSAAPLRWAWLRAWWRRRWVTPARRPVAPRRLFLVPTPFGLGWVALVLILLVLGINYHNNLAYGLAFWLFAVALVALWRGLRNLLGVRLVVRPPPEAFVGIEACLEVRLQARRPRSALSVALQGQAVCADIDDGGASLGLGWSPATRGRQPVPPLRLESAWPLGLVRAIAWVDSGETLLVYPHPRPHPEPLQRVVARGAGQEELDFAGLRRYQPGDGPARLAWKQWSRTGVLATKQFEQPPQRRLWLDYAACEGEPERRLSALCAQVLAHHRAGDDYGLRLPGVTLGQGSGPGQRRRALKALALWSPPASATVAETARGRP